MKITGVTIITTKHGSDKISLTTDLAQPSWPFSGNLSVNFEAARGSGLKFCQKNWPDVNIKVVDMDSINQP